MKDCYTLGVDFGTLSARAVLASVADGSVVASSAMDYPSGVLTGSLPGGVPLSPSAALADPADYRLTLMHTLREVVRAGCAAGIRPEQIIAIGLDATASTFLPVDVEGKPLCENKTFRSHPHAWLKLWKHHSAGSAARDLAQTALARREAFLQRTGGNMNAEWMLPKVLEIYREDPLIWQQTDRFMEIGDYLIYCLSGTRSASRGPLGYKLLLSEDEPSISEAFLSATEPGFESLLNKIAPAEERRSLGETAGLLSSDAAANLGLPAGLPIAAANIDAHVAFPTLGISDPNRMLLILGTSCCTILLSRDFHPVPGVFGIVKNGVLPGFYGYESGQSAVGDLLAWFTSGFIPTEYKKEAAAAGISVHDLLSEKASRLIPGESGLLALDWLNGNRSVLADTDLTGLLLGLTLQTKPEEIYRAFIESLAFGLLEIIDSYEQAGIPVKELYATGGIARKNPLFMQIYADVTGRSIRIARAAEGSALGSAIFAAACAGSAAGGHEDLSHAIAAMGHTEEHIYTPFPPHHAVYRQLFQEYHRLHDCFGRGENHVMKHLLAFRREALLKKAERI